LLKAISTELTLQQKVYFFLSLIAEDASPDSHLLDLLAGERVYLLSG
jgi:hypothetical protein